MFKPITFFLAALVLLVSCSIKEDRMQCTAPVTVSVSGFNASQGPFPDSKATALADYPDVKAMTLAIYKVTGNAYEQVYFKAQYKDSPTTFTTFGSFNCTLPYGSYKLVVIGHNYAGNSPEAVIVNNHELAYFGNATNTVKEAFTATKTFSISNSNALNLTATLDRIVSKVVVATTDNRPSQCHHIVVNFSKGSTQFNPSTGLAANDNGFTVKFYPPAAEVGTPVNQVLYLFLASDEETMDITLTAQDQVDNPLYTTTVQGVPLKRNRVTTLSGAMFSPDVTSGSFQLNTEWGTGNAVNY